MTNKIELKRVDGSKIGLSTSEKQLYDEVVNYNKKAGVINEKVKVFLSKGKTGIKSVERVAKVLKDNKEPLHAYKMAVYRFYKDQPKDNRLSLQGLGVKGSPFIGKPSNSGQNSKKKKDIKITNIDTVVKSINTADLFDHFESQFKALESVDEMNAYIDALISDRDSIIKQRLKAS